MHRRNQRIQRVRLCDSSRMAQIVCVVVGANARTRLAAIINDRSRPLRYVQRARIVLLWAERLPVLEIAHQVGVSRPAVWRCNSATVRKALTASCATRPRHWGSRRQRPLHRHAEIAAGELHVAVGVALEPLADRLEERPAVLRLHALRHRDDAAAVAVAHGGDVVNEPLHRETPLRHVDEVRPVAFAPPPRRAGRGQETGMAPMTIAR
jgi:Homeodomain-like domain